MMEKCGVKRNKGKDKKKSAFDLLKGKEVSFQLLKGTIIEGTFAGREGDFFIATNATIIGANNICKTEMVFIHKNQVQHLNLRGEIIPKT